MGMGGRHASRHRIHEQAWHYLLGLGPDVAFVQEGLPPSWIRSIGTVVQGPFKQTGSAIFSPRFPLERVTPPEGNPLLSMGAYVAMAHLALPDGTEGLVASVHAVARKANERHLPDDRLTSLARSREGTKLNDVAVAGLAAMVDDRPFIFAGDWNVGRIRTEERDRAAAAVFFDRIAGHRWRDCVWDRTKAELRTWYRNSESEDDQGLRQNDHIFCSLDLFDRMAADAWVATDAATVLGLSDHAPLIVEFDVPPIGLTNLNLS